VLRVKVILQIELVKHTLLYLDEVDTLDDVDIDDDVDTELEVDTLKGKFRDYYDEFNEFKDLRISLIKENHDIYD